MHSSLCLIRTRERDLRGWKSLRQLYTDEFHTGALFLKMSRKRRFMRVMHTKEPDYIGKTGGTADYIRPFAKLQRDFFINKGER